jgi:hypothetical protein
VWADIMNAKLRQDVLFLIPLGILLSVSTSYGQETLLPYPPILQAQIAQQKDLVATWEFKAKIEFFLGMLVVVFGGVVAFLQKVQGKKWCPYFVVVSGIVISTLT